MCLCAHETGSVIALLFLFTFSLGPSVYIITIAQTKCCEVVIPCARMHARTHTQPTYCLWQSIDFDDDVAPN